MYNLRALNKDSAAAASPSAARTLRKREDVMVSKHVEQADGAARTLAHVFRGLVAAAWRVRVLRQDFHGLSDRPRAVGRARAAQRTRVGLADRIPVPS